MTIPQYYMIGSQISAFAARAYLRASTDNQDLNNQKLEILEFARQKNLHVDEFVAITASTPRLRRSKSTARVDKRVPCRLRKRAGFWLLGKRRWRSWSHAFCAARTSVFRDTSR